MRQELVSLVQLVFGKAEPFVVAVLQMLHVFFLGEEMNLIVVDALVSFNKREYVSSSLIVVRTFGTEGLSGMLEVVRDWFVSVRYGHGVVKIALDCVVVGPLVGCDPALVLSCFLLESRAVRVATLAAHVAWFAGFSVVRLPELIDLLQEERLPFRNVLNVS